MLPSSVYFIKISSGKAWMVLISMSPIMQTPIPSKAAHNTFIDELRSKG